MSEQTERERWMEAILSGEKNRNDPEVALWLQKHPEAAVELDGLIELAAHLDSAGGEQRETLSQSREFHSAADEGLVESVLGKLFSAKPRGHSTGNQSPAGTRRFPIRLAVAAVLIATASLATKFFSSTDSSPAGQAPVFLGESTFNVQLVSDAASQSRKLSWTYKLSPGGWYSLSIWNISDPLGAPAEFEQTRYFEQECQLHPKFGPTVRVQLIANDAGGEIENSWIGEVR